MAARNMFIEIYEYPYKFMTFAHTLGRPHGGAPTGLCRNSQKLTHSKTVDICSRFLLTHLKDVFEHYGLTPRFAKIKF